MVSKAKGDNFVMDLENFTNGNQVIYTLDTICEHNSMTLAQAVLEIFCSQDYLIHEIKISEKDNSFKCSRRFKKLIRSSTHWTSVSQIL